jgi:hypothetical protein
MQYSTPEDFILEWNGEKIAGTRYEGKEWFNMSNAWMYVGFSKPHVDRYIVAQWRAKKLSRRKIPKRGGYFVDRETLDRVSAEMHKKLELVPDETSKQRAEAEG